MRIEFEGTIYDYDPADVSIAALIVIKDFTGHGYESWIKSFDDLDPRSLQALWWLMRRQNGVVETIAAVPDVNALALLAAFTKAVDDAPAPDVEADPTDPTAAPVAPPTGATTPTPVVSEASTSSPSPTSAI
ncbi:hypothetical protein [Haloactinopolyspora sp.]|uniref:hypothetical protein n=1 Tax=Haloactinopolyspora sp. TaxID=1966353 RepID=UPI00262BB21B|nr:hypothetical protein [Haloactinopolyspora sp.]